MYSILPTVAIQIDIRRVINKQYYTAHEYDNQ